MKSLNLAAFVVLGLVVVPVAAVVMLSLEGLIGPAAAENVLARPILAMVSVLVASLLMSFTFLLVFLTVGVVRLGVRPEWLVGLAAHVRDVRATARITIDDTYMPSPNILMAGAEDLEGATPEYQQHYGFYVQQIAQNAARKRIPAADKYAKVADAVSLIVDSLKGQASPKGITIEPTVAPPDTDKVEHPDFELVVGDLLLGVVTCATEQQRIKFSYCQDAKEARGRVTFLGPKELKPDFEAMTRRIQTLGHVLKIKTNDRSPQETVYDIECHISQLALLRA